MAGLGSPLPSPLSKKKVQHNQLYLRFFGDQQKEEISTQYCLETPTPSSIYGIHQNRFLFSHEDRYTNSLMELISTTKTKTWTVSSVSVGLTIDGPELHTGTSSYSFLSSTLSHVSRLGHTFPYWCRQNIQTPTIKYVQMREPILKCNTPLQYVCYSIPPLLHAVAPAVITVYHHYCMLLPLQ